MGGLSSIMKFIPGLKNLENKISHNDSAENSIMKQEAIILSMTKYERSKPKIINGSRKKRIAMGSGTKVSDINRVLKQHKKMTDMLKKFSKNGMGSMSPDQLSGQFGNMIPSDIFKK